MAQREHFSRVGKRHRTFTGRVECREQVDKKRDHPKVRLAVVWDVEAEAGCEQSPGHVRESEQQEGSATEGIDGPNSWLLSTSASDRNEEKAYSRRLPKQRRS